MMIEGRDFAAAVTVGTRERQEDDWGIHANPPAREEGACLLAAVADGMGGAPAGDQASRIVIRAFMDSYLSIDQPAGRRLRDAMLCANDAIELAVQAQPNWAGMGATLVTALFFPGRCEWLSVGDSFILLCRDGRVERVNPLHIYANELQEKVRRGEISAEQALQDPDRNALSSALMGWFVDEVAQGELRLAPGDAVLLASDGIASLSDEEIASICTEFATVGAAKVAETLVAGIEALNIESQDNVTVVAVVPEAEVAEATAIGTRSTGRGADEETPAKLAWRARFRQTETANNRSLNDEDHSSLGCL